MAAQKPADVADGVIAGVTEPLGDFLGGEKASSRQRVVPRLWPASG